MREAKEENWVCTCSRSDLPEKSNARRRGTENWECTCCRSWQAKSDARRQGRANWERTCRRSFLLEKSDAKGRGREKWVCTLARVVSQRSKKCDTELCGAGRSRRTMRESGDECAGTSELVNERKWQCFVFATALHIRRCGNGHAHGACASLGKIRCRGYHYPHFKTNKEPIFP